MSLNVWNRFAAIHHKVQVDSRVDGLLRRGVTGINQLKKIASVEYVELVPDEYENFFLPWYTETAIDKDVRLAGS